MTAPETPAIPGITDGDTAPHFFAPWQAKLFAMTVALNEAGVFGWDSWAAAFGARLKQDTRLPDRAASADHAAQYFTAWADTFEALLAEARLTDADAIRAATRTWQRAALATPHGTPIRFEAGQIDH